jgi:hypothetical protein
VIDLEKTKRFVQGVVGLAGLGLLLKQTSKHVGFRPWWKR